MSLVMFYRAILSPQTSAFKYELYIWALTLPRRPACQLPQLAQSSFTQR